MDHSLSKLYHSNEQNWQKEYLSRFNSPYAVHLGFEILEHNHTVPCEAFYCPVEEIAVLLGKIMSKSVVLTKLLLTLPGALVNQFLYKSMLEEIRASNEIEGVRSSRRDLKRVLDMPKPSQYVRLWGIVNKYKKILSGQNIPLDCCEDIRQLYDDFILEEVLHSTPENRPDGVVFRKGSVEVVSISQKVIHSGCFPEAKILSQMGRALEILHDERIPKLIRIALFHYMFGYIHPFYDGNGRMCRFITSYLLAGEIDATVALRLSWLIKKNKKSYYRLFREANSYANRGELTQFIVAALQLLDFSVNNTLEVLQKKITEFEHYKQYLDRLDVHDNTTTEICKVLLQASVFSDFGTTIEEICSDVRKSRRTVQSRLEALPKELLVSDRLNKRYHYKLNLTFLTKK